VEERRKIPPKPLTTSRSADTLIAFPDPREVIIMDPRELEKQRQMRVVKSNDLIRKGRFNLSVVEQRIVLYMITNIKPTDERLDSLSFDIQEFCEVCGIKYQQNLSQLKDVIKELADKSMWVNLPNGKKTLIRWIEKPYLDLATGSGIIELRLDRDLAPYLLNLKSNFTEYQLISVLALRSKYSIKLYELLKSYCYIGRYEIRIEDLKEYLLIEEQYKETKYFNKYVIARAIDEINEYTDIEVSYEYIRHGKVIVGYQFQILEQEENKNILARAYLSKKRPTKYRRELEFKEYTRRSKEVMDTLQGQISLYDEE
jgi:plasmid replication initiation protein